MTTASQGNAAFYCPTHQVRFHTDVTEIIQCDRSPHALGLGFPSRSSWTYCCDCATFSPYDPLNGNGLRECLVCEREIDKRYLCNNCQVISVESNALVRRKTHSINEQAVQPNCPACASKPVATTLHKCAETGTTFLTGRPVCLFCDNRLVPTQTPESQPATRLFCGGCGTELTPPFKFCKRCGRPRAPDETQLESHTDTTTDIFVSADEDLDKTDPGKRDTADVIPSHDSDSTNWDGTANKYSSPWDFTSATVPRKRSRPWIITSLVGLLSLSILITVALRSRKSQPTPLPKEPTPQPLQKFAGMAYVAGGEFMMGNDTGDEYERPAHKVRVSPFYIDINEVTCEDYLKFVTATSHRAPPNWEHGTYPSGGARRPVTGVDWNDATAYAEWAGKRLPTEEEWEFAAKAATNNRYPWGNDWRDNAANAGDSSAHQLVNVGSYPEGKTSAGLMDMIGNAWEWTSSDVVTYPGGHFASTVPKEVKVIRGGSWQETNQQATTTYRGFVRVRGAEDYSATGFRCAKDAGGKERSQ